MYLRYSDQGVYIQLDVFESEKFINNNQHDRAAVYNDIYRFTDELLLNKDVPKSLPVLSDSNSTLLTFYRDIETDANGKFIAFFWNLSPNVFSSEGGLDGGSFPKLLSGLGEKL